MVNLEPYVVEGRWHRVFVESDAIDITITSSDIECELDGQWLKLPLGFHVMGYFVDFNSVPSVSTANRVNDIRFIADGNQEVFLPTPANFDYGYVYILGYIKE